MSSEWIREVVLDACISGAWIAVVAVEVNLSRIEIERATSRLVSVNAVPQAAVGIFIIWLALVPGAWIPIIAILVGIAHDIAAAGLPGLLTLTRSVRVHDAFIDRARRSIDFAIGIGGTAIRDRSKNTGASCGETRPLALYIRAWWLCG